MRAGHDDHDDSTSRTTFTKTGVWLWGVDGAKEGNHDDLQITWPCDGEGAGQPNVTMHNHWTGAHAIARSDNPDQRVSPTESDVKRIAVANRSKAGADGSTDGRLRALAAGSGRGRLSESWPATRWRLVARRHDGRAPATAHGDRPREIELSRGDNRVMTGMPQR
eukprot:6478191-Prymnesium_polylepis.1